MKRLNQDLDHLATNEDVEAILNDIHPGTPKKISEDRCVLNYFEDLSADGMTLRFNYWIVAVKGGRRITCGIFIYSFLKEGEAERQVIEELELLDKTLPAAKLSH